MAFTIPSPMIVSAQGIWGSGLSISPVNNSVGFVLTHISSTPNSSSQNNSIYSARVTYSFSIIANAPQRFAVGSFTIPLLFSLSGGAYTLNGANVSIFDSSLPDGFTCALQGSTNLLSGSSLSPSLIVTFPITDFTVYYYCSVTFDVSIALHTVSSSPITSSGIYSSLKLNGNINHIYSSYSNFTEYINQPTMFYQLITSIGSTANNIFTAITNTNTILLNNVISKLDSINSNITKQSSNIQANINKNTKSIIDLLTNYDGSAGGLNQSNANLKEEMDSFHSHTDTSAQMNNIKDSIFDFNTDIFTSMASTATFFSALVTLAFNALGELSVALTLFLVMIFVSVVIGIVSHVKGG